MLDACTYDKIKLIHKLSTLAWFLEKHGIQDAQKASDKEAEKIFNFLKKDFEEHIEMLKKSLPITGK